MIRTYFDFIVEEKINELIVLIEKIDESKSDDSIIKTKMNSFVKFAFSKGEKIGLSIVNFFLEKIRKNKKAAFTLLSVLFFSAGLSLNTIFGELNLSTDEQQYVKGLSIQGDSKKGSPIEPYDLKDSGKESTEETDDVFSTKSSVGDKEVIKEIEDIIKKPFTTTKDVDKKADNAEKQKAIKTFKEKGFKVVNPSTIKVGSQFNKKTTVFTSAEFPYNISKNYTKGVLFKYENQVDLIGRYIPELDRIASNEKIGLKLLALSMTYMEGYIKRDNEGNKSVSYATNNPGNIGNTDDGKRKYCKTLEEGINLQIGYIKDVAYGRDKNYPLDRIKKHEPYYSDELKKYVPGFIFLYEGTLEQFLKIYATGPRDNNNYLNTVLTFFETYMPGTVTPKTKIKDIINMGGNQRLVDLIQKSHPEIMNSMAGEMSQNGYSTEEISEYTGLSEEEVKKCKPRYRKQIKPKSTKSIKKPYWDIFGFY